MVLFQFLTSTFFFVLSSIIAFGFGNVDASTYFFIAALAVSAYTSWKATLASKPLSLLPLLGKSNWRNSVLALVIGLSFFTLAMKVAPLQPATPDEISHALNAIGEPYYHFDTRNIVLAAALHHQPPLDYVASSASLRLWGLGEVGARFPSIVFACLTLAALFLLCREVGASNLIAILTTFFCGTSSLFFQYALDGRPYTAGLFTFTLYLASSIRMLLAANPRQEIYSVIGAGTLFVMSVGMQPAFMMLVITFFAPIISNFQWRNTFSFFISNALTAAVTTPVLALIASRAVLFTPQHAPDVYNVRALALPKKIVADVSWFSNELFSMISEDSIIIIIILIAAIAGLYCFNRRNIFAEGSARVLTTFFGLVLTFALFNVTISSVFTMFIEHPFGPRHIIVSLIILCVAFAILAEWIVRTFSFDSAVRWVVTLCLATIVMFASSNNLQNLEKRLQPMSPFFDARSLYSYFRQLPMTAAPNWTANGYALDLLDTRFLDYSGFFAKAFYAPSDFPSSIYINQEPRKNLPVWHYLIDDIRAGRTPSEFIFLSFDPFFAGIKTLSVAEVPWTKSDGVSVVKISGFIITRLNVNSTPMESAIRFFEKIHNYYAVKVKPEDSAILTLLLETLTRLYLESHRCDKATEIILKMYSLNQIALVKEFPELLNECRSKK